MNNNQNQSRNFINLINLIKKIKYGRIEIIIKDGQPTDIHQIITNVKLDVDWKNDLNIQTLDDD